MRKQRLVLTHTLQLVRGAVSEKEAVMDKNQMVLLLSKRQGFVAHFPQRSETLCLMKMKIYRDRGRMGRTKRTGQFLCYTDEHYGLWVTWFGMKTAQQSAVFQKNSFHIHFIFLSHKTANNILNIIYIFPSFILIFFRTLNYFLKGSFHLGNTISGWKKM